MADITLKAHTVGQTSANFQSLDVVESLEQATLIANEAIKCGAPVYIDPATGKWQESDGNVAARQKFYGVATRKAAAGEAMTAIARGVVAGYDFTAQAYGTVIFANDNQGVLGDVVGTVSIKVGEVVPVLGQTRGNNPMKALRVRGII